MLLLTSELFEMKFGLVMFEKFDSKFPTEIDLNLLTN